MNTELAQAFCYGIAQGEKLRIANLRQRGITLTKEDSEFVTSDPGEHINAGALAVSIIHKITPSHNTLVLVEAIVDIATAYDAEKGLGIAINEARVAMLFALRQQEADLQVSVIERLAQASPPITVDLTPYIDESQKP